MRSFVTCAVLASVASIATATIAPRWDYPESVPLIMKRQAPGTPQYACHENCGLAITYGREAGYCTNPKWTVRFDACMICANTYNIWQFYSTSVGAFATACGLTAVPSPSGYQPPAATTAAPSTTAPPPAVTTTTTTPVEEPVTSTTAAPPPTETTSAPTSLVTKSTSSTSITITKTSSVGTIGNTFTPKPSTVTVNGAAKNFGFFSAVGVSALAMLAAAI